MQGYRSAAQLPTVLLWCAQACSFLEDGPSSTTCLCLPDVCSHPASRASHRAKPSTEMWEGYSPRDKREVMWQRTRRKAQSNHLVPYRDVSYGGQQKDLLSLFLYMGIQGLAGRQNYSGRGGLPLRGEDHLRGLEDDEEQPGKERAYFILIHRQRKSAKSVQELMQRP